MGNPVGSRDQRAWKPPQFKHFLSLGELAERCQRDTTRIKQLEREGRIPAPIRIKVGRLQMRLYSPAECAIVIEHFKNAKPGRPITTGAGVGRRKKRRKKK